MDGLSMAQIANDLLTLAYGDPNMNRERIVARIGELLDNGIDPATITVGGVTVTHAMFWPVAWSVRHIVKAFLGIMEHYSRHPEFDMTKLFADHTGGIDGPLSLEFIILNGYYEHSTALIAFFYLIGHRPRAMHPVTGDYRIRVYTKLILEYGMPASPFLAALILGTVFNAAEPADAIARDAFRLAEDASGPMLSWPTVLARAARNTVVPTGTLSYIFYELNLEPGDRPSGVSLHCIRNLRAHVRGALGNKYPVWKPSTYRRYPVEHRRVVRQLMLVANRLDATFDGVNVVRLPLEMWFFVVEFLPVDSVPPAAWCMRPMW